MSAAFSTRFAVPSRSILNMVRPICSVVVAYWGRLRFGSGEIALRERQE
jgi:hypothetical protein